MTIRIGEIGKSLYIATGFDLSGNSELQINFTSPDGKTKFTRSNPDVTAPATDSPSIPGIGVLPANTYLLYLTQADDFIVDGEWCNESVYIDLTPKKFIGSPGTLIISKTC
tara:strand:- start:2414 stop:2746 length:333 start_codon:yes stop_codon:yes gene_type:complete